jgi:cobalt-zinc-cadmium resistance protein CzcA
MDNEVNLSASKMMNSAVFGQIIILVVYFPYLHYKVLKEKCLNQWHKQLPLHY